MSNRAIAPVVGVAVLVAITVILSATVWAFTAGMAPTGPAPSAVFEGSIDVENREITLRHVGGDELHMEAVGVVVSVNDDPLDEQPPVPFFAAAGFVSGPTGPFNPAATDTWGAGEAGSFRLASTNGPIPVRNDTVSVRIAYEGEPIASIDLEHR